MKKLLMIKPTECASGDTTKGKVYNVLTDVLVNHKTDSEIEFNEEMWLKNSKLERWITIEDNSSKDDFQVYWRDDRFLIFDDNKALARYLIEFVDGVADAVANLYMTLNMNNIE